MEPLVTLDNFHPYRYKNINNFHPYRYKNINNFHPYRYKTLTTFIHGCIILNNNVRSSIDVYSQ
jgi:hypothetical protein